MQFDKLNVLDERFEEKKPLVKMYRGASETAILEGTVVGGSTINSSRIQFNLPLTPANYFDRAPLLKTVWSQDVVYTNKNGAGIPDTTQLVAVGQDVTMSAYPFTTNCIGIAEVTANGTQIGSYDMSKYSKILLRLADVQKNMNQNTCPSCPELTYANINDAQLTMSNPQASFNDANLSYIPNGAWKFDSITNNGAYVDPAGGGAALANNGTVKFTFTVTTYEPLVLPPFLFDGGKDDETAIFGLNNLQLTLNLNSTNAFRALRCLTKSLLNLTAGGVTIGPPTNLQVQSCILKYQTMSEPNLPNFRLPSPNSIFHTWNFYSTFIQSTVGFPNAAGTQVVTNLNMTNVNTSSMPSLILVWCDKPDNTYAQNYAKYFYPITNLKISLGTKQNLLANYDVVDLYRVSKQCGLNQSYLSFIGGAYANSFAADGTPSQTSVNLVGGPIALRPAVSFPLPPQIATNAAGTFTFGFSATCQNSIAADNTAGVQPYLNILFVYDQWVSINTNDLRCSTHIGMLTPPEIAGVVQREQLAVESQVAPEVGGLLDHKGSMSHHQEYSEPSKLSKFTRKKC